DELRVEQANEVGHGSSKQIGGGLDHTPRPRVPRRRRCQDVLGSPTLPSPCDGRAGYDRLQPRHPSATATSCSPGTGPQPPDRPGDSVTPAVDAAVADGSAANAGTD